MNEKANVSPFCQKDYEKTPFDEIAETQRMAMIQERNKNTLEILKKEPPPKFW
jgi:hypothetical protein